MANIIQMNSGMGWDVSYKRINTNFNALNNELAQVNLTAEQKIAQANANAQTLAAQAQAREEDKLAAIYEQINLTNQALIDKAQEITDHFDDNLENVRTEVEESQSSWARRIIGEDIDAEGTEWKTLTQLKQDYSTISSTVEQTQKTLSEEYATKSEVTQTATNITLSIKGSLDSDMQNLGYKTASQLSIEDGSIKSEVEAKINSALTEGNFITKTNFEQTYKGFTWSVTKSDVEDAAKTATSFMDYNETHSGALTLGYKQNGALANGTHAVLGTSALEFHYKSSSTDTTVAKFGAGEAVVGDATAENITITTRSFSMNNGSKSLFAITWDSYTGNAPAQLNITPGAGLTNISGALAFTGNTNFANTIYARGGVSASGGVITASGRIYAKYEDDEYGCSLNYTSSSTRHGLYSNAQSKWMIGMVDGVTKLYNTSSRKVKTNIEPMPDDMALALLDLEPVTFDYKPEHGGATDQTGVIAEDAGPIVPEAYVDNVAGCADDEEESEPIPGIDYVKYIPRLIKLCQVQQERIEALEERLRD